MLDYNELEIDLKFDRNLDETLKCTKSIKKRCTLILRNLFNGKSIIERCDMVKNFILY